MTSENLKRKLNDNLPNYEKLTLLHTHDGSNAFHTAVKMRSNDILDQLVDNIPGKIQLYINSCSMQTV